jgi:hypothetical protein
VWVEWGARLVTLLALLIVIAGLLVLALPEAGEGAEVVRFDAAHGLRVADFVGAVMVAAGVLSIWATVLAWQRRRIE